MNRDGIYMDYRSFTKRLFFLFIQKSLLIIVSAYLEGQQVLKQWRSKRVNMGGLFNLKNIFILCKSAYIIKNLIFVC